DTKRRHVLVRQPVRNRLVGHGCCRDDLAHSRHPDLFLLSALLHCRHRRRDQVVTGQQTMTQKNILILMSDEQRWDTLGYAGNAAASTPTLDALAACGTSFTQAATAYPLCCPARTSLWTSHYPHEHHVIGNWRALRPALRDGGAAADFAEQGYHTIYTGKWHVPGTTPARMGFQD